MEMPMPAVKALIKRDGKILSLETEAGGETYWVLPGGKVEYGEEPLEALKREIEEEISCEAEIGKTVGMYHFFTGPEDGGDQVVLTAFEAEIGDQDVDISDNPADENIVEYHWLEPEELMEKTGNGSLRKLIRDYAFDTPKLVRDKIPEIIGEDDDVAEIREVEGEELLEFLAEKLVEEAKEFCEDREKEELGDVLDVIEVYRHIENIDEGELENLRVEKTRARGSFLQGYVLEDLG